MMATRRAQCLWEQLRSKESQRAPADLIISTIITTIAIIVIIAITITIIITLVVLLLLLLLVLLLLEQLPAGICWAWVEDLRTAS